METLVEVVEGRRNPWIWMWFTPRKVMRQIIDFDPAYRVLTLGALTGIYRLLNQAVKQGYGDFMSLPTILILCLILGSIAGILGIFISGWYFRWIGSWFGGKANAEEVRAAIAWSSMPDIVMLVLVLPFIFVYGIDWFNSAGNLSADLVSSLLLLAFAGCSFLFLGWRIILFIKCLAEAHEVSSWKAAFILIVGTLILAVPFFLLKGF